MHSYIVDYEGKVIGSYSSFTSAESFILSCLQNKFMKDFALIHTIRKNSCFRMKTKKITLDISYKKEMLNKTCKLNGFNCKNTFSNSESDIMSSSDMMSSSLSYESSTEIMTSTCASSESDKKSKLSINSTADTISTKHIPCVGDIMDPLLRGKTYVSGFTQAIQIDYSNPVILDMAKQKIELQH